MTRGTITSDLQPSKFAGDVHVLSWVADSRVPAWLRKKARRLVDRAARDLGLQPPAIRWFGPAESQACIFVWDDEQGRAVGVVGSGDFWLSASAAGEIPLGVLPDNGTGRRPDGWDLPDAIGLHYGLRGPALVHVCAHEVRHLAQLRDAPGMSLPEREADAYRYGDAAVGSARRTA